MSLVRFSNFSIATPGVSASRTVQPNEWIPQLGKSEFIVNILKMFNIVIVTDDISRESEGDLIMAAELVTPENITFFTREAGGLISVAGTGKRIEELDLELVGIKANTLRNTNFGITIDAGKRGAPLPSRW